MTRGQKAKRKRTREAIERKKLFGGSGDIYTPHVDMKKFIYKIQRNGGKNQ